MTKPLPLPHSFAKLVKDLPDDFFFLPTLDCQLFARPYRRKKLDVGAQLQHSISKVGLEMVSIWRRSRIDQTLNPNL